MSPYLFLIVVFQNRCQVQNDLTGCQCETDHGQSRSVLSTSLSVCCSGSKYASFGLATSDWSTTWVALIVSDQRRPPTTRVINCVQNRPSSSTLWMKSSALLKSLRDAVFVFFPFGRSFNDAFVEFELSLKIISSKKINKMCQNEKKNNTCFVFFFIYKKFLFTLYSFHLLVEDH